MDKLSFKFFRAEVSDAFDRHDPIGLIAAGAPAGEYQLEVSTVIPRLVRSDSAGEIEKMLHEVLVRWFGDVGDGPLDRFRLLSEELVQIRERWFPWDI